MDVSGQHHVPAAFPPAKSPGTNWIADWVCVRPRDSLDGFEDERNLLLLPGFELWTVQPVTWSLYRLRYPGCPMGEHPQTHNSSTTKMKELR
jgi:hypothetical protein